MRNTVILILIKAFFFITCSFDNSENSKTELIESYSGVFNDIEVSLDETGGDITLTIIGERANFSHPTHVFASIDLATNIYKKKKIKPISVTKIWMEEESVTADRNVSINIYIESILKKYKEVFKGLNLKLIRDFFINHKGEQYNHNYIFYTFKDIEPAYQEMFPENIGHYVVHSILSNSTEFHKFEDQFGSRETHIQAVIDMYLNYEFLRIDCEYHEDEDECDKEMLNTYKNDVYFLKNVLKLAGKDEEFIKNLEWNDMTPKINMDAIDNFEDIKEGKHLED